MNCNELTLGYVSRIPKATLNILTKGADEASLREFIDEVLRNKESISTIVKEEEAFVSFAKKILRAYHKDNATTLKLIDNLNYEIKEEIKTEPTGNNNVIGGEPVKTSISTDIDNNIDDLSGDNGTDTEAVTAKNSTYVSNKINKKIVPVKTLENARQIGSVYFGGYNMELEEFLRNFGADMFRASIIDFKNGRTVESNDELDENIGNIFNEIANRLYRYLKNKGYILETEEDMNTKKLLAAFDEFMSDEGLTNTELFKSDTKEEQDRKQAYLDYITCRHFDELISFQCKNLIGIGRDGKYKMLHERKVKNNYSDGFVDIFNEISRLSSSIIEATPLLGTNWNVIPGQYLTLKEVLAVNNKLKNLSEHDLAPVVSHLRMSPEERYRELLMNILNDTKYQKSFSSSDMNLLRSIYNYYYKLDNDNANYSEKFKVLTRNSNTDHSIAQMLINSTTDKDIKPNVALTAINCLFDKTISQKYVTLSMNDRGLERKLTSDLMYSKYVKSFLNGLDDALNIPRLIRGEVNIGGVTISRELIENKPIYTIKVGHVTIKADLTTEKFKQQFSPVWGGNNASQADIEVTKTITSFLEALIGTNLSEDNYKLAKLLYLKNNAFDKMMSAAIKILDCQHTIATNLDTNGKLPTGADFAKFAEVLGVKVEYGGLSFFNNNPAYYELANDISSIISNIKGDNYNQTSKNLNGDALPNNSMISLIFDYRTAFQQAYDTSSENAIQGNALVQNENWNIIDSIVYRQDVKTKDGRIKVAKSFNSGEIAYQSVLSDFWGEWRNGKVMIQPTVYSDKPGQAMVAYNLNRKMKISIKLANGSRFTFDGTIKDALKTKSKLFGDEYNLLDEIDYYTQQSQWTSIYNKLINDYKGVLKAYYEAEGTADITPIQIDEFSDETVLNHIDTLVKNKVDISQYGFQDRDFQREFHKANKGSYNTFITSRYKLYNNKDLYKRKIEQANKKFITQFHETVGDVSVYSYGQELVPEVEEAILQYLNEIEYLKDIEMTPAVKEALGKKDMTDDQARVKQWLQNWVDEFGNLKLTKNEKALDPTNIYEDDVKAEINPILSWLQSSHRALSKSFVLATVGGEHGHLIKTDKAKAIKDFKHTIMEDGSIVPNNPDNLQNYVLKSFYKRLKKEHNTKTNEEILAMAEDELWHELEESFRLSAMFKRMVSMQAKFHPITQKTITGISQNVHMAVMEDIVKEVFNSTGSSKGFDVSDGGGWVPMVCSIMMKNSMGDAGLDTVSLKAIRHALDPDTQIAHLDKYAAQALCNETLRRTDASTNSWCNLNKYMLSHISFNDVLVQGSQYDGNIFSLLWNENSRNKLGIKHDLIGPDGELNWDAVGRWLKDPSEEYKNLPSFLKGITYNAEGDSLTSVEGIIPMGNNRYGIIKRFHDDYTLENNVTMLDRNLGVQVVEMNNLYDVWTHLLGGAYSVDEVATQDGVLIKNNKRYIYTDKSNEMLSDLMNNIVIKQTKENAGMVSNKALNFNPKDNLSGLVNQDNYYQPLKDCIVWQVNNDTGMKNGAKNPNSNSLIKDGTATGNSFVTNTMWWGIQGNFDHGFDDEHISDVSEPTQMLSACETMGIMTNETKRLYDSIATVIRLSLEEKMKAYNLDTQLYSLLAEDMINQLKVKDRLGVGNQWSEIIDNYAKTNKIPLGSEKALKMALSDGNIYGAVVSMVSGSLNSGSIRRKNSGIAAVLSQSHDAIMVYDDDIGVTRFTDDLIGKYREELLNSTYMFEDGSEGIAIKILSDISYDPSKQQEVRAYINHKIQDLRNRLRAGNYTNDKRFRVKQLMIGDSRFNAYDKIRIEYQQDESGEIHTIDLDVNSSADYYNLRDGNFELVKGLEGKKIVSISTIEGAPRNLRASYLQIETTTGETFNELDLTSAYVFNHLKALNEAYKIDPTLSSYEAGVVSCYLETYNANPKVQKRNLIKYQQQELNRLVNEGKFIYKGQEYIVANSHIRPGEVVLPNVNAHKYGITEGTALGEVTREFFMGKFTRNKITDNWFGDNKMWAKIQDGTFGTTNFSRLHVSRDGRHVLETNNIDPAIKKEEVDRFFIKDGKKYYKTYDGNILFEKSEGVTLYRVNDYYILENKTGEEIDSSEYIGQLIIENGKITPNQFNDLYNRYIDSLVTSWEHQLKVIGSRIPTQALQSIMAMKVVGFTEKNINRAYVPVNKNWLDGSDFS